MFKKILLATLILLSVTSAFALNKSEIGAKVGMNIKSISPTPLKNISEVITENNKIFYIDSTSRYIFDGSMLDMDNHLNLTQKKLAEIKKVDFKSIPLNNAIKTGRGAKKIVVFHNPDCSYCRKLHFELKKLKGTEVYNILFVSQGWPKSTYNKTKKIYCAKDPINALDKAMSGDAMETAKDCGTTKVDENRDLAGRLGINGTPIIILENGHSIEGFRPADIIRKALDNI